MAKQYKNYEKISIPSGTIKRLCRLYLNVFLQLFQFLLVRLKVSWSDIKVFAHIVFQFLLVRLKELRDYLETGILRFQFLLVRLKGNVFSYRDEYLLISIPSGTIKRYLADNAKLERIEFQFLLVRLKDTKKLKQTTEVIANFNSFWYD